MRRRPPPRPANVRRGLELAGRPPGQPGRGGHRRGRRQQTWENFGRAWRPPARVVEDGGAIAVCCELAAAARPGRADASPPPARGSRPCGSIRKDRPADALPAAQLARTLDRDKVYLLSRLDPALVEELDMIPIAGGDELARLARRHRSCILVANAPRAVVTVEEEQSGSEADGSLIKLRG